MKIRKSTASSSASLSVSLVSHVSRAGPAGSGCGGGNDAVRHGWLRKAASIACSVLDVGTEILSCVGEHA
eukprot:258414-Rhodomonas_salina.1